MRANGGFCGVDTGSRTRVFEPLGPADTTPPGRERGVEMRSLSLTRGTEAPPPAPPSENEFDAWRSLLRRAVLVELAEFASRRAAELDGTGVDAAGRVLAELVWDGKCLRSTFMYLGWLRSALDNMAVACTERAV